MGSHGFVCFFLTGKMGVHTGDLGHGTIMPACLREVNMGIMLLQVSMDIGSCMV